MEKSYSSSFLVEGNVYALKVFTWRYTPGNFLYLVYRTITRGRDQTPNGRKPIASSSNFERNSKWTEFYLVRLQKDTLLISVFIINKLLQREECIKDKGILIISLISTSTKRKLLSEQTVDYALWLIKQHRTKRKRKIRENSNKPKLVIPKS